MSVLVSFQPNVKCNFVLKTSFVGLANQPLTVVLPVQGTGSFEMNWHIINYSHEPQGYWVYIQILQLLSHWCFEKVKFMPRLQNLALSRWAFKHVKESNRCQITCMKWWSKYLRHFTNYIFVTLYLVNENVHRIFMDTGSYSIHYPDRPCRNPLSLLLWFLQLAGLTVFDSYHHWILLGMCNGNRFQTGCKFLR